MQSTRSTERVAPSTKVDRVEHRGRSWLLVVLVAVIALLIVAVVGWMIGHSDSEEPVPEVPAAVSVRGDELTARKQEMVRVGDELREPIQIGDSDVVELFTERGVLTVGGHGAPHR